MRNPNVLRPARLLPGAAMLAAGAIACAGKGSQNPEPTGNNAPSETPPACTKILPTSYGGAHHTMGFNLATTDNVDEPNKWQPDHVEYNFGDKTSARGSLGAPISHDYPHAGRFPVDAKIILEVADGISPPVRDSTLRCPPLTVDVP